MQVGQNIILEGGDLAEEGKIGDNLWTMVINKLIHCDHL
jgi:hypothetical protein